MSDDFNIEKDNLPGRKENPFKVPENYFDDFPMKMQERIIENKVEKRVFSTYLKPGLAYTFVLIVVALISVYSIKYLVNTEEIKPQNVVSDTTETKSINSSSISEYLFDDDIIIDEWLKIQEAKDENGADSKNEIIDYLMDYEVEEQLLLAEL